MTRPGSPQGTSPPPDHRPACPPPADADARADPVTDRRRLLDCHPNRRHPGVDAEPPGHRGAPPVVADGTVYVLTYSLDDEPAALAALDLATGERVGADTTEGAGRPGVAATGDGLVVVDRLRHPRDRPPETPGHTRQATPAGTPPTASERPPKPARAYGVPADLSGTDWRVELPASSWTVAPPVVAGEHVYVGSRTGVATALDVDTGERAWTHEFDVELDLYGPAVVDGVCVFGSSAGLVALAVDCPPGRTRSPRISARRESRLTARPARDPPCSTGSRISIPTRTRWPPRNWSSPTTCS
jgi:hypothetical protein